MNISYITTDDARDIQSWSGLNYYIAQSLGTAGNTLDFIGPLKREANGLLWATKAVHKLLGKAFDLNREPAVAANYARQIGLKLKTDTDLIFSPGSIPISLLQAKQPKVFFTDASFAGMIGFYAAYSNYCEETIRHGHFLEKMALDSSSLVIYSSDWAAKTAMDAYGTDASKIRVVPFGANIENHPHYEAVKSMVQNRSDTECQLLFLGVDWERKGGDLAVALAASLNQLGQPCKLHIAGIPELPHRPMPDFVVNHGFISKSDAPGRKALARLFETCHFLVLPTRADCSPVVLAEANAFGIPCLTTNVGGIPTIIRDFVNGKCFSLQDGPEAYASFIMTVFNRKEDYAQLCYASYHEFETRLNWRETGKQLTALLRSI